ncbi:transcriptional regulator, LysR family [Desulfobulbus propionicus DSM 2032]|jgi:LysR family positive regulator for ilvC|uniref:Transcriptional regulator, LysR family n=1 Tax=Desulfobulbus propionicus (strain ATCC 33891 / DSM 2032 / VKM B-1956 / 1pr3) TaxID=577650 RepID=A0A7U4DQV0_DESPD|nr:HTH-type transcriptional activator IlvY [Desulfobulbus propionicus]ADW19407.1 transcriptional regulator, LysR family [Desulfobulbus propionicus DSM 2032]
MDIHAIKIFNHLARTLHFGRTSRACNLTPSALTRTIQRIEQELGTQLFLRDNRRVALTPAGEIVRRYAEEAEQRWQRLLQELAGDQTLRGEISLYCSVTAATSILPRILRAFRAAHPGVQIKLQTGDAAESLDRLRSREAQVTIAALPGQLPPSVVFIELARTPLVFIEPVDGATRRTDSGGTDWSQTPVILAEQGLSRVRIDRWFKEKGIQPNIYAEVAGNEALLAMVSLGCGVGVVPGLVLEKSPLQEQVRIFEVVPVLAPFIIGACTLEQQLANPVIRAFWTTVHQENKEGGGVENRPIPAHGPVSGDS